MFAIVFEHKTFRYVLFLGEKHNIQYQTTNNHAAILNHLCNFSGSPKKILSNLTRRSMYLPCILGFVKKIECSLSVTQRLFMIREIILSKNVFRNEENYEITVCLVIRIPNIRGFMDKMCQDDIYNQENYSKTQKRYYFSSR